MVRGLTRSNIDWTQFGWPIITGCKNLCKLNGEIYCYAYKAVTKGRLKGHPNYNPDFSPKMNWDFVYAPCKRKKPATIFIAPLGEMWGRWVPLEWQDRILEVVRNTPQHTFLSLTKNPGGFHRYQVSGYYVRAIPQNLWLGVSVTGPEDVERLLRLRELKGCNHKFVSFEPLLEDVTSSDGFDLEGIKWVIIGALSKGAVKVQPDPAHIVRLYRAARQAGIPVFMKDNCTYFHNPPKEFPEGFPA